MCYRIDNSNLSIEEVSEALRAEIVEGNYFFSEEANAFNRPALPVVLDYHGRKITHSTWGIIRDIPREKPAYGLNLQAEKNNTVWRKYNSNRCLLPVTGFYDFMHLQEPGKKRPKTIKHRIHWKNADKFYIPAYYDVWENKEIGFGLLTSPSNELMSIIHNSKQRMPICLDTKMADAFLDGLPIEEIIFPNYDPQLVATNLEPEKMPNSEENLFNL